VKLVLDSHVLIWRSQDSDRLPPRWAALITDSDTEVFVSAASVWEVEIKKHTGKLALASTLITLCEDEQMTILDITPADAVLAGSMEWSHKDPFDRMLVAQARERGLTIATTDAAMLTAPGVRFLG